MLDLAKHIVETKSADFEPSKFEDRYENALVELLNQKRKGVAIHAPEKQRESGNVINLMDALRKSLSAGKTSSQTVKTSKAKKRDANQREMLMPIPGKASAKAKASAKETKAPSRAKRRAS
jgi:DNA end-binding protein Ku